LNGLSIDTVHPTEQILSYNLYMGLDYGVKRIGISIGNKLLREAKPCQSVSGTAAQQWTQIAERILQWEPEALVVGVPFHPDGAEHENTHKARRFMRQLEGRFKLPVFEVDERYSTTEAISAQNHGFASQSKKSAKVDIDSESACIILNQFFRTLKP